MDIFSKIKLKHVNRVIICLIILIDGYLVISPLLPQFDLWKRKHDTAAVAGLPYKTKLDKSKTQPARAPIPTDNRLVIPKIALNEHIYQGTSPYTVDKGVWIRPNASTPPAGSNTVMVAHRFTYSGPATFYSLNQLAVGDSIVVYWLSKEYDYKVVSTTVVPPTDLQVEDATANAELTLYTCTPLWSFTNRLVVVAKPVPEPING